MTAALRPVSDADAARMALSVVQALRAQLSAVELTALLRQHFDEMLDGGYEELARLPKGAAFLRSVANAWAHTAGLAAAFIDPPAELISDIAEYGADAALQRAGRHFAVRSGG